MTEIRKNVYRRKSILLLVLSFLIALGISLALMMVLSVAIRRKKSCSPCTFPHFNVT